MPEEQIITKLCRDCGKTEPETKFSVTRRACDACRAKRIKWLRKHPEAPRRPKNEGRPEGDSKRCRRCGETKLIGQFPLRSRGVKHGGQCKICVHKRQARWLKDKRKRDGFGLHLMPENINELVKLDEGRILRRIEANSRRNSVTGCREWLTAKGRKGYGFIYIQAEEKWFQIPVHRVIASLFCGLDLRDGRQFSCHHCDNPCCNEPSHLFKGTAKDNSQDAKAKGRLRGNTKKRKPDD